MKVNKNYSWSSQTRGNKGDQYCRYSGSNYNFDWCAIFTSYIMREVAGIKEFPNYFPKSTSCTQIKNSPLLFRSK